MSIYRTIGPLVLCFGVEFSKAAYWKTADYSALDMFS